MDNSTQGSEAATDWGRNHENSHQFIARIGEKQFNPHVDRGGFWKLLFYV